MNCESLRLYQELAEWRDDELKSGNMTKVRSIQKVIRRIRKTKKYIY